MSDVVDSVNQVLQDCQDVETSSFYKDYQSFSKMYDSLIQEGITRRRESQLRTIQDHGNNSPIPFNIANK